MFLLYFEPDLARAKKASVNLTGWRFLNNVRHVSICGSIAAAKARLIFIVEFKGEYQDGLMRPKEGNHN